MTGSDKVREELGKAAYLYWRAKFMEGRGMLEHHWQAPKKDWEKVNGSTQQMFIWAAEGALAAQVALTLPDREPRGQDPFPVTYCYDCNQTVPLAHDCPHQPAEPDREPPHLAECKCLSCVTGLAPKEAVSRTQVSPGPDREPPALIKAVAKYLMTEPTEHAGDWCDAYVEMHEEVSLYFGSEDHKVWEMALATTPALTNEPEEGLRGADREMGAQARIDTPQRGDKHG